MVLIVDWYICHFPKNASLPRGFLFGSELHVSLGVLAKKTPNALYSELAGIKKQRLYVVT